MLSSTPQNNTEYPQNIFEMPISTKMSLQSKDKIVHSNNQPYLAIDKIIVPIQYNNQQTYSHFVFLTAEYPVLHSPIAGGSKMACCFVRAILVLWLIVT